MPMLCCSCPRSNPLLAKADFSPNPAADRVATVEKIWKYQNVLAFNFILVYV